MQFALRAVALGVVILWLGRVAWILIESYWFGPPAALVRAGMVVPTPIRGPLVLSAIAPAVAVAAAAAAPWLSRLLAPMPMPRPGCPFCDHRALPETGSKCPECGRVLPDQLLRGPEPTKLP